jgi:hypothetical protein
MNALAIGSIVFICVFGGALLGMFLRSILPEHHVSAESKDAVKVGIGLIATMAALVLGLLVATTKASYDTKSNELTEMSANTLMLDRMLAHYGPETRTIRELLRRSGARSLEMLWPQNGRAPWLEPAGGAEVLYAAIQSLRQRTRPSAHSRARRSTSRSISARCAGCCSSNRAVRSPPLPDRAGFLAHYYFYELRHVCAA